MLDHYCVVETTDYRVEVPLSKNRCVVKLLEKRVDQKFAKKKAFPLKLKTGLKNVKMTVSPKWRQSYGLGGCAYFGKTKYNGIVYDVFHCIFKRFFLR